MFIQQKDDCQKFESVHGESVWELAGKFSRGAIQHSLAHVEIEPGKASLKHYHTLRLKKGAHPSVCSDCQL